ncbi:MAG TPA: hypothetical protein VIH89_03380 [Candidatus Sulfotelmatobacter sp.]
MKTLRKLSVMVGAIVVVAMMAATANAGCGDIGHGKATLKRQAWASEFGSPALRLVSEQDNDPITGLWKVTLMAGTTTIDSGYSVWHADGTEINNSGDRAPMTGSFCLGVWKKINNHYKLNHVGLSWDSTGTVQLGAANLVEDVVLGPKGNVFSGTFTITQYDMSGNVLASVSGTTTATRVGVDTVINSF